ncbi:hypothetical protein AAFF_G00200410 [Aldrovandia affinis]|uniref:Uncharacterized protein n=1 Tax=Aldrovandia affinis TaxID=143900 RepID=A0AAD7RI16_9TELE|nr:hypothetical protein AAFF_G00200410 [Aldrovandia affinis]
MDGKGRLTRTQHSQSCTDISKHRRDFEEEEDDEEDAVPLLGEGCCLYKSPSLERSLASGGNLEIYLESGNPEKTMSSIKLPSKSILKKKQGQGGRAGEPGNFRKVKSMEALSSRDEGTGPGSWGGGAGRLRPNEKDLENKKEEARKNLVKEKLQFSAFLNEITRQVLSPSRLSSLGVTNTQRPSRAGSASLKSSKSPREERQVVWQEEGMSRQQRNKPGSPDSMVSSAQSYSSRHSHSSQHSHPRPSSGTPQLQHHTSGSHTDGSTSPENISWLGGQRQDLMGGKRHPGGSKPLLTDGTNTSPELSPSLPRHSYSHSQSDSHEHHQHNYGSTHHSPVHPKPAHHPTAQRSTSPRVSVTPERESRSSKSDSSRNTASPCPGEPPQSGYTFTEEQLKDVTFEVNRIQFLQKQNEELHHSLLQTAMRMESMEAEFKANHQQLEADMQRTQAELVSLKDKFKRLQDNYSTTQQANHLLEKKLHLVDVDGERVRLNQRILELTNQLATAQTTIQSLENINVPSLLQEALGKQYEAEEAANQLLLPVAPPPAQFMDNELYNKVLVTGDDQVLGPVLAEEESDWSEAGRGSKGSGGGQQNITAFLPWKQEQGWWVGPERARGGDGDMGSDSEGNEEFRRHPPPHSLQIPHLQFTMHPETLPVPTTDVSLARFRSSPEGPPSRVLSDDLEICSTGTRQHHAGPATLKSTEAIMDLHRPRGGAVGDANEDDVICDWRKRNSKGSGDGDGDDGDGGDRGGDAADGFESGTSLHSYQPAPRVMSHLVRQLQPMEVETRGWVVEEVLNGERTQL